MSKKLYRINLFLVILSLVACSDKKSGQNTIKDDIVSNQQTTPDAEAMDKESNSTDNEYTIKHEKDDKTYTVTVTWDTVTAKINDMDYDYYDNYRINLFDTESNQLQSITLESDIYAGIDFEDVNLDGYTDIVVKTGGTSNETHELYNWDVSKQNFSKVSFEGFDMLSFFEVHDGYINNFLRGSSPEDSEMLKLIWEGNTLIKVIEDGNNSNE